MGGVVHLGGWAFWAWHWRCTLETPSTAGGSQLGGKSFEALCTSSTSSASRVSRASPASSAARSWVQCVLCCCNVVLLWVALFRSQAKNFSLKLTIYGFLFAVCRLRLAMIITVGWIFGQLKAVIHWPESTAGP